MNKRISPILTLLALVINAFAIGSTEFISVGLMPLIVNSFHVTLAQAGLTVSLYAIGVTIGAPLLTVLTGKWNRKYLMIVIMLLFIIGNLVAAFALFVFYALRRKNHLRFSPRSVYVCF